MEGELAQVAVSQGGFVYRWQVLDCGYRQTEIERLLRCHEWCRVRRGVYAVTAHFRQLDEAARHALVTRAVVGALTGDVVVAGYSALAVRGVPVWGVDGNVVHVYRDGARSARTDASVVHHEGPPPAADVEDVGGLLVAAPELALADAARTVSFEAGVVLADGALRLLDLDRERLRSIVREEQGRWRGAPAAGRVLEFADGRAETVGESRSRVVLARLGLPRPELQHPFSRPDGSVWARTDFWIAEFSTAGEFDGRQKYGRSFYERNGRLDAVDVAEVLWAEKRREDAIRGEGAEMVRWVWSELDGHDDVLQARFRSAFDRNRRRAG